MVGYGVSGMRPGSTDTSRHSRPASLPPGGSETIDAPTALAEQAILGLRLTVGIDETRLSSPDWCHRTRVGRANGLAEERAVRTRLTQQGRLFANEVFGRLLPEYPSHRELRSRRVACRHALHERADRAVAVALVMMMLAGLPGAAQPHRSRPGAHHLAPQPRAGAPGLVAGVPRCSQGTPGSSPAKVHLPVCGIEDIPTRYGKVRQWKKTLLDTNLKLRQATSRVTWSRYRARTSRAAARCARS